MHGLMVSALVSDASGPGSSPGTALAQPWHSPGTALAQPWGPRFLERPSNLTGPESDFEIKASRKVGHVLNSNKVHFVFLANNYTVQFSNLLKLPSGMENKTA